jgi:hypothetical protein
MKPLKPPLIRYLGFRPTGDLGPFTLYTSRRRKLVFFPRSPPTSPASPRQLHQRNKFRNLAQAWNQTPETIRAAFRTAVKRCSLALTPFNLFLLVNMNPNHPSWTTLERIAQVQLHGIQLSAP